MTTESIGVDASPTDTAIRLLRLYTIDQNGPYVFSAKYRTCASDGMFSRSYTIGEAYRSLANAKSACKRRLGDVLKWRTCQVGGTTTEWWEAEVRGTE